MYLNLIMFSSFQVVYDEVTELQGHVLMLIVKSKDVFVGAINIQLGSVPLNEEKWYPLGNSIIWALLRKNIVLINL